jgi:nucleoporin NUP159
MLRGDKSKDQDEKEKPAASTGLPPVKSAFSLSTDKKDEEEVRQMTKPMAKDESFGTQSTTSTSSFVDVSRDVGDDDDDDDDEDDAPGRSDDEDERGENAIDDFLSDTYSDGENDEDDGSYQDDGSDDDGQSEDSGPNSKSPPRPSAMTTRSASRGIDEKATARAESTTPPGSPSVAQSAPSAVAQPKPTPPTQSSTGANNLSVPNTRPTRSSPLANAITADESGDEEKKGVPRPASPKTPFGTLPSKIPLPLGSLKPKSEDKPQDEETKPQVSPIVSRPKTPPATTLFGFGKSGANKEQQPATVKQEPPPSPSLSSPGPSIFSKPPLFGGTLPGAAPEQSTAFGIKPSNDASKATTQPTTKSSAPSIGGFGSFGGFTAPKPTQGIPALTPASSIPPPAQSKTATKQEESMEPMQAEFARLFVSLAKELENVSYFYVLVI